MSRTYFDAVLGKNSQPVFNGTAEETKTWLEQNREHLDECFSVCEGRTLKMTTIDEYLEKN